MKFILAYLLIVNAAGFASMLADKHRAKENLRRIPEANLLAIAVIGGSIGSLLGMYTVRHKTKHKTFTIGIPLILAVQVALVIWILL